VWTRFSDAETLLRCELQVPLHERAEPEPGWTFTSDLTGCTVYDDDREIGRIEGIEFGAGEAPLLIVQGKQKTPYEIPYAEAYLVKVDLAGKQIRMRLPEGMLEINAALTEEEKREQKAVAGGGNEALNRKDHEDHAKNAKKLLRGLGGFS